jgi:hypothetical protein
MSDPIYIRRDGGGAIGGYAANPQPGNAAFDTAPTPWDDPAFQAWLVAQSAAPRRLIKKSVVQERVNAIGKLGDVFTALNANPINFARWFAPDWPEVYADDPGLLAVLAGVECTSDQIATVTAP